MHLCLFYISSTTLLFYISSTTLIDSSHCAGDMHHREAFAQAVLEALRGKALVELDDAGQHAGAAGLLDDGGHFAGPARRASCVPQACVTPWPATFQPARGLSFSRPACLSAVRAASV